MPHRPDPVLVHATREGTIILSIWAMAAAYCCVAYWYFGLSRPDRPLGPEDVNPILGVPSWFVWGVLAPWAVSSVVSIAFAAFVMKDDDLGSDHTAELERDIREGGSVGE